MPLPIPELIRDNVTFDILAIGIPVGLAGYLFQESITRRRVRRRQALLETRASIMPQRRRGLRATESHGLTPEQLADDLAQAIDAMVEFVDGKATVAAAGRCAHMVEFLVPAPRRGTITKRFLDQVVAGANPDELQEIAEEVCVQMALELRALRDQLAAKPVRKGRAAKEPKPSKPAPPARPKAYGPARAAVSDQPGPLSGPGPEPEEEEGAVMPARARAKPKPKPAAKPKPRAAKPKPAPVTPAQRPEDIEATLAASPPPRPIRRPAPVFSPGGTPTKPKPAAKPRSRKPAA